MLLLAPAWSCAAYASCGANGARYAPRPTPASRDVPYRMTILPPPSGTVVVAERYRFELLGRRSGRRLSRVDLDLICGMGRAPCAMWQPGKDDADNIFHSVVVRLNADFSPVRDWRAADAIVFAGFSENEWATALALHRFANVRYYTRPHVEPDLSARTVWVRAACGRS
ncbi:hypothetical protein [Sphingomonas bacterium]|uniref:hypothetical protein n=1 Tax=Sphingomonas bacterium TaxID=1895847 RepID=UPI001576620A|nr:hypothetical protein [Sphingomonas bacterium]